MDLKFFDTKKKATEGVEIELRDVRSGLPTGVFIKVIGTDSERFVELSTERARKGSAMLQASASKELTKEQQTALTIELLVGCTLGWRGLEKAGEPLEFTEANARMLYSDYPAIREQINFAIADRGNFLAA